MNRGKVAKEKRVKSWKQCMEARSKRTDKDQLARLDAGKYKAVKERKRIINRMEKNVE